MGSYCLTSHELRRFIEVEIEHKDFFEDERDLRDILDNWHCWEIELILFATTFSQQLERMIKADANAQAILQHVSDLQDDTWLTLEGFDHTFVTYMFNHRRLEDTSVEDELIRIKQLQSDRWYW